MKMAKSLAKSPDSGHEVELVKEKVISLILINTQIDY